MTVPRRLSVIGFGEVGLALASALIADGKVEISVWDVLFDDPTSVPSIAARTASIRRATNAADAMSGAEIVISAVTAAECQAAASSAADCLPRGAYFLDLNSVSPKTKVHAAAAITAAGGRYVEAAVMSPISPARLNAPILIGGPSAAAFLPIARELGFGHMEVYSDVIGRASAAKMCRSVMIKGIEALLTEALVAARRYGVEATVIESLGGLLPFGDWQELSKYMISRSLLHGKRRADEMREAAIAVADTGLTPWMSAACAQRQDWAAAHAGAAGADTLQSMLDSLLASIPDPRGDRTC